MNNVQQQLDQLYGELAAFKALSSSLIATHPNPKALLAEMQHATEQFMASSLPHSDISEPALEALQTTSGILLKKMEAEVQKRA